MHYLQSFVRTTDTANYLQSIVRADSSKVKSFFALGDSTNTQRSKGAAPPTKTKTKQYPRFDSKKAAATVALSSASASPSSTSSQSAIPFPCAPEDVISAYDDLDPFAAALEDIDVVPAARAKRACPAEGRRRRCQTPLHTPASRRKPSAGKSASPHPILRVDGPSTRSTKRVRKSKRVVADLQFAVAVHRSISRRSASPDVEARRMDVEGEDEGARKELDVQERLLVDRLGQHLLEQGCNPAPLDAPPTPPVPALPARAACAEEDINMDVTPVDPALDEGPRTPPTSPTMAPSPPPSPQSPEPRVYTMPQLVATLIMRHRDRRAVKSRVPPPRPAPAFRKRSALAEAVVREEELTAIQEEAE
ncbi:hypothetical protein DENSPDRAFT_853290 [Dentipellis sp. KUC8613]|nr:hypothetical protein DENSPDRAFT_853290 [Dentipellis sp. KUC8613]